MKSILIFFFVLAFYLLPAQNIISGIVEDAQTHELLRGVNITYFKSTKLLGIVSNEEGKFSINNNNKIDSLRFSMIGYHSKTYKAEDLAGNSFITVNMETAPATLQQIVVHAITVLDIVKQTAQKIPSEIPAKDFESNMFYREIIKDDEHYYSVAEAVFAAQFIVQKKSFKLKLEKGRSKEDVAYTRLFEDFHPGGGPEDAVGQSLAIKKPDFLNESKLKNYVYKKDPTIKQDDNIIYVISFDQQPGLHEALEKGKMYINADDFSLLKYEAENSPAGTPYIKSLKGADKIFAELLNIDLTVRGWTRTATFTKINDKLFLDFAKMGYQIDYKQPKKQIDLHLLINTELVVTDFQHPIVKPIGSDEEWKRKNLVANLPSDFDSAFWGTNNIISPTTQLTEILNSISKKNNDEPSAASPDGWQYLNKNLFITYAKGDSIILVPIIKCSWEDKETGGMIYKKIEGDFSIETKLSIKKRSNALQEPDNGFQQSGIIIRNAADSIENNFIFSMGTGGNSNPKYFLKKTLSGKTKSVATKIENLTGWLKIEKRNNTLTAYIKTDENSEWKKADTYTSDWLKGELQIGFSVMDHFPGNGPKQHADMKAMFSNIKISKL